MGTHWKASWLAAGTHHARTAVRRRAPSISITPPATPERVHRAAGKPRTATSKNGPGEIPVRPVDQFDSGTGWPSVHQADRDGPGRANVVSRSRLPPAGASRTEVRSAHGNSHRQCVQRRTAFGGKVALRRINHGFGHEIHRRPRPGGRLRRVPAAVRAVEKGDDMGRRGRRRIAHSAPARSGPGRRLLLGMQDLFAGQPGVVSTASATPAGRTTTRPTATIRVTPRRRDRLRPRGHRLPGAAGVLLPDPRPQHQEPPGQRHRHQLPLGDLHLDDEQKRVALDTIADVDASGCGRRWSPR